MSWLDHDFFCIVPEGLEILTPFRCLKIQDFVSQGFRIGCPSFGRHSSREPFATTLGGDHRDHGHSLGAADQARADLATGSMACQRLAPGAGRVGGIRRRFQRKKSIPRWTGGRPESFQGLYPHSFEVQFHGILAAPSFESCSHVRRTNHLEEGLPDLRH